MKYDAAVIGAGAAGLIAARDLARSGRRVVLLEARGRFGGRLFEARDPRALGPIELGGEFVHGRPAITYALLREFGSTVVDDAESSFFMRDGALREADEDPFELAGSVLQKALENKRDCTVDDLIARVASAPESREAGEMTRRLVSGFDAADPARASARSIALEWVGDASADGAQSRPLGGYAPLIAHLARSLDRERVDVRTRTIVESIARDEEGVRIHARGAGSALLIDARHAIVTVPHGVLSAATGAEGAIAFDPPLPASTRTAIAQIAMGPVVKIVLSFKTRFWEDLGGGIWRDGAFFGGDEPFPTFWTQLPVRTNTLTAWAGGPVADRLANATFDERVRIALASAATYFDDPDAVSNAFECAFAHDWDTDPFSRGAYSFVLAGGEDARMALAQPIDDVLWFAGEATASHGEGGTVAGALESGTRAAREIVACGNP